MSKKTMDDSEMVGKATTISIVKMSKHDGSNGETIVYSGTPDGTKVIKFYYTGSNIRGITPRRAKTISVGDIIYDNNHPRFKSVREFFEYAVSKRGYKHV